jgi:hypothetical protein
MQNIDEVLLHKHCKEGAFVATYFFYLIFYKLKKNRKITMKNLKIYF